MFDVQVAMPTEGTLKQLW